MEWINWTETADLNAVESELGASGTTSSALAFGGEGVSAGTEEWTKTLLLEHGQLVQV